MTLKDEIHRSAGIQHATGEIAPKRKKRLSQSGDDVQLWMYLVVKVKSML